MPCCCYCVCCHCCRDTLFSSNNGTWSSAVALAGSCTAEIINSTFANNSVQTLMTGALTKDLQTSNAGALSVMNNAQVSRQLEHECTRRPDRLCVSDLESLHELRSISLSNEPTGQMRL